MIVCVAFKSIYILKCRCVCYGKLEFTIRTLIEVEHERYIVLAERFYKAVRECD